LARSEVIRAGGADHPPGSPAFGTRKLKNLFEELTSVIGMFSMLKIFFTRSKA